MKVAATLYTAQAVAISDHTLLTALSRDHPLMEIKLQKVDEQNNRLKDIRLPGGGFFADHAGILRQVYFGKVMALIDSVQLLVGLFKSEASADELALQLSRTRHDFHVCKLAFEELMSFLHIQSGDRAGQLEVVAALNHDTDTLRRHVICLHKLIFPESNAEYERSYTV